MRKREKAIDVKDCLCLEDTSSCLLSKDIRSSPLFTSRETEESALPGSYKSHPTEWPLHHRRSCFSVLIKKHDKSKRRHVVNLHAMTGLPRDAAPSAVNDVSCAKATVAIYNLLA